MTVTDGKAADLRISAAEFRAAFHFDPPSFFPHGGWRRDERVWKLSSSGSDAKTLRSSESFVATRRRRTTGWWAEEWFEFLKVKNQFPSRSYDLCPHQTGSVWTERPWHPFGSHSQALCGSNLSPFLPFCLKNPLKCCYSGSHWPVTSFLGLFPCNWHLSSPSWSLFPNYFN